MSTLKPVSILSSLKEVSALPVSWFVKRVDEQRLYMLDLKNSGVESISHQVIPYFTSDNKKVNLDKLQEDRTSIRQQSTSSDNVDVFREPELILKIDLSLNGISEVAMGDISTFTELRSLDLSLNAIHKFQGVAVASKLVFLNLSYNNISQLPNEALAECVSLQNLNLSVNKISSLRGFPNLTNLIKLTIRGNRLRELQGLQVLRSLQQLDASKNKLVTIVHICPCLEMTELILSDNNLSNVPDIVSAISPLSCLKQLRLKGNPSLQTHTEFELQATVAKNTSVDLLDGVNIRPAKLQFKNLSRMQPPSPRDELKVELKDAVKESMTEARERQKKKTHDSIAFLHKKIITLLDELEEFEVTSFTDTDAWCRYIDTLTTEEAKALTVSKIRAAAIAEPDGYLPPKGSEYQPRSSRTNLRK